MAKEESHLKLRCSLIGHSMDVRAVTITSNCDIITASRDKTAILWTENPDNRTCYIQKIVYAGHKSYVTSICYVEGADDLVATGSKDSTILVFHKLSSEPFHKLIGHTDSVSCIIWKNDYLVSGSWDHTVRIWKDWNCISILENHTGPIWSVAIIGADHTGPHIISASADKTLKLWKNDTVAITYNGHSDCVRGVTLLNQERFLSCSNDASIKLWNISGECLATYFGHTNFIYSIFSASDGQSFVSGSEDRSLRIWNANGTNTQTLYLPAQSVWSVAVLPNSDVVVGTSDGICRVFTRTIERHADDESIRLFEDKLSQFKVAVDNIGGIKKDEIPDKTFLNTPGKRDGQTVMVREGNKVMCYNWSQAKVQWEAVGEVVGGSSGSSGKVLFEGREYDFVFDVDLDTGTAIKLPYNNGEDPWVVAQSFIHRHELPQDYLDTVASFITKNAGVTGTGAGASQSYDPFTGGNRYVPGGSQNGDVSSGGNTAPVTPSSYFPQMKPLPFESINKEGIVAKLKECNSTVADPITDVQIEAMVNSVASATPDLAALKSIQSALQWHPTKVWPVLDVLRLALRFETVQTDWMKENCHGGVLVDLLVQLLSPESSPSNTQLLSLRCLSNMASHAPGREVLASNRDSVITAALKLSPYPNKNMEIASATLMVNYSFIFHSVKNIEDHCQVLSGAATIALSASDPEALFRSLVAMGTLLSLGGELISLANSLDLKPVVENLFSVRYPQKVQDCARDVAKRLSAV